MRDSTMEQLRCRYENTTNAFQIVVIVGLERFLSPGSSIEFDASPEDSILIKDAYVTSTIADNIPCQQLLI